jgi:hypothetical protein
MKCQYCNKDGINEIQINLHEITGQESGLYDYVCDEHLGKHIKEYPEDYRYDNIDALTKYERSK